MKLSLPWNKNNTTREVSNILKPIDLEKEIKQSDVTHQELDLISSGGGNIWPLYDFIRFWKNEGYKGTGYPNNTKERGVALGKKSFNDFSYYSAISKALNLREYYSDETIDLYGLKESAQAFGFDLTTEDHTEVYLRSLKGAWATIIFFVPPSLRNYEGYTSREFDYLLDLYKLRRENKSKESISNPYFLNNIHFVFGLEHSIEPETFKELTQNNNSYKVVSDIYRACNVQSESIIIS